jgi:hypothetical protein
MVDDICDVAFAGAVPDIRWVVYATAPENMAKEKIRTASGPTGATKLRLMRRIEIGYKEYIGLRLIWMTQPLKIKKFTT